jgi:hypothetical protein
MDRLTHSFVLVSQQQASNSSSWLFDSTKQQQWTSFDALNFQQLDIELKFFDSIMINNKIFIAGDCTHSELVVFDVIDGKWSSLTNIDQQTGLALEGRCKYKLAAIESTLYWIGGEYLNGTKSTQVWSLDLSHLVVHVLSDPPLSSSSSSSWSSSSSSGMAEWREEERMRKGRSKFGVGCVDEELLLVIGGDNEQTMEKFNKQTNKQVGNDQVC